MKKLIAVFLVALLLLSGCQAPAETVPNTQTATVSQSSQWGQRAYECLEAIQERYPKRIAGSDSEHLMGDYILACLDAYGCEKESISEQRVELPGSFSKTESRNIIYTKKGASDRVIVVGAHYDSVNTHGVDDNGSGVSVLLECISRLEGEQLPNTVRFVFFGAEEGGLYGSEAYVDALSEEEREELMLMINIDSVLAGDKSYMYSGKRTPEGIKNTEYFDCAWEIALERGLKLNKNPGLNERYPSPATVPGCSDYTPFDRIGVPYLYFEATNWEIGELDGYIESEKLGGVMHTQNDDLEIIEKSLGERARENLSLYCELLDCLLKELEVQK